MKKINLDGDNDFKITRLGENSDTKVTKIDDKFDTKEKKEDSDKKEEKEESEEKVRPKFFSKTSISIIVITFIICGLVITKYYRDMKKVIDAQNDYQHNYATTTTTTTEESTTVESTMTPEQSVIMSKYLERDTDDREKWADEDYDPDSDKTADSDAEKDQDIHNIYFNIENDKNYKSQLLDIDTISIDGHLIDFPADYKYLKNIFGEFTFENQDEDFNENSTVEDFVYAVANAKTGYGIITFTFSSEGTPKPLNQCNCIEVQISSINNNKDAKNMTVALPGNVKFGDTYEYLKENFPYTIELDESSSYYFMAHCESSSGVKVYFTAENNRITDIIISFK